MESFGHGEPETFPAGSAELGPAAVGCLNVVPQKARTSLPDSALAVVVGHCADLAPGSITTGDEGVAWPSRGRIHYLAVLGDVQVALHMGEEPENEILPWAWQVECCCTLYRL